MEVGLVWEVPGSEEVPGGSGGDLERSGAVWMVEGLEDVPGGLELCKGLGGVRGDLERSGMEEGSEEVGKRAGDGGIRSSTWVMMGRDSLTKGINGKKRFARGWRGFTLRTPRQAGVGGLRRQASPLRPPQLPTPAGSRFCRCCPCPSLPTYACLLQFQTGIGQPLRSGVAMAQPGKCISPR